MRKTQTEIKLISSLFLRTEDVGEISGRDLYETNIDGRAAVGENGLGIGEELTEVGAVGGRHLQSRSRRLWEANVASCSRTDP